MVGFIMRTWHPTTRTDYLSLLQKCLTLRLKLKISQDELQRDLMQERWDLIEQYPAQLRSFVPLLTTYTDSAFPSDIPTDKGLRVALRYEVGRFFASLED
jgi:hypothetical protein